MKVRVLLLITPAVLLVLFAALHRAPTGGVSETATPGRPAAQAERDGRRLVVVIVDSLRQATLEKPAVMPHLLALAEAGETARFTLLTCSANFSLPCLQTLMEGRQSPFVSGLHNFTGIEGGAQNIARSLQAAGLRLAIVGDHTLLDLYGRHAAAAWGVESVAGDPLQRDLAAVSQAVEWLEARPAFDALLLHVPGTDKAAHHKSPGTAAYDEHHRRVDQALARVWERIDPAADDLIIMGDHGHDEQGDHTRLSLVLMRGPRFAELLTGLERQPAEIAQEDLLFFMSYPFMLPLPRSYEGRFFPLRADAHTESLDHFEELQRRALGEAEAAEVSLVETLARREATRREAPRDQLFKFMPLFSLALLWAVFCFRGETGSGRFDLAAAFAFGLLAAALYRFATPAAGPAVAALLVLPGALAARRLGLWRRFVFMSALLGAAGAMGFFAPAWAELMHSREAVNAQAILFHLFWPLAGAGLAVLGFGRAARFPEGMALIGILVLPSGVYYYQSGRNLLLGFALGEAVLLAGRWVLEWVRASRSIPGAGPRRGPGPPGRRRAAAMGVFLFAAGVLLVQEAGGWEWDLGWANWMRSRPECVAAIFYWAIGGYLAWLVPGASHRMVLLAALGTLYAYAVVVAGLSLASLTACLTAVLLMAAVGEIDSDVPAAGIDQEMRPVEPCAAGRSDRDALLLTGVVLWMLWALLRGFFINRIEYRFAFDLVGEFGRESTLALAVGAATLLKYGLPLFFALLVYTLQRGRQAALQTFSGLIFLLQLKLIALLAQALLLPLATAEKLYELAVADTAFVLGVLLIVVLTYSALRISSSLATNRSLSLSILNSLSTRVRPARPMTGHEAGELNSRSSCAARASASRSGTR